MTYKELADNLLDFALLESAAGATDDPTPRQAAAVARCINGAMREIRNARRNLFKQRHGWNIVAPFAVTFTAASNGYAVNALTPAAPNSGVTLRAQGMQVDMHLAANLTGSDYTSDIPFNGSLGAGKIGTIYHDAVLIHRGKDRGINDDLFESIVGDVRFNRRPLVMAKNIEEVERRLAISGDYGQPGGRARLSQIPTGDPMYYWGEVFNVDGNQTELRLRIAPLPSGVGSLEANVVRLPTELVAADITLTTKTFGLPGNMDYDVLLPIAMKRWLATPFCSVRPDQAREIERQYQKAETTLATWRPLNSKSAMAAATNQ